MKRLLIEYMAIANKAPMNRKGIKTLEERQKLVDETTENIKAFIERRERNVII